MFAGSHLRTPNTAHPGAGRDPGCVAWGQPGGRGVIPFWAPAFAGVSGVEVEVWVSWLRTGMFAGSHLRTAPQHRSSRRRPGSRLRGLGSAWRAGC